MVEYKDSEMSENGIYTFAHKQDGTRLGVGSIMGKVVS